LWPNDIHMLNIRTRARGWPYALLAAGVGAIILAAWIGLELQQARAGHGWAAGAPGRARLAGASFAFICDAVGPSLPYLSAALFPAALAVMALCLLQMSIVLVTAVAGVAAGVADRPALWREGLVFAAGFLAAYTTAAAALGLAGQALASYAFVLKALGGALVLLLGLAVLRVLPGGVLSGCRGPRWLIMTGKASLRRPLSAGVAFAVYCAGCCGPYLSGLALLGAGTGTAWQGAALIFGFALLMGALLLLPIFALPASRRIGQALIHHARPIAICSGTMLVVLGTVLLLEPALVWAFLTL
jgi:cytochrome c-type biogenesis protein